MFYSRDASRRAFRDDVRRLYDDALKARATTQRGLNQDAHEGRLNHRLRDARPWLPAAAPGRSAPVAGTDDGAGGRDCRLRPITARFSDPTAAASATLRAPRRVIEPGIGECDLVRLKGKAATDVLVGEGQGNPRSAGALFRAGRAGALPLRQQPPRPHREVARTRSRWPHGTSGDASISPLISKPFFLGGSPSGGRRPRRASSTARWPSAGSFRNALPSASAASTFSITAPSFAMRASRASSFLRRGASATRRSAAARRSSTRDAEAVSGLLVGFLRIEVARQDELPVIVHVALERLHGAAADEPQAVRAGLDEEAVVADEDDRALVIVDRFHQGRAAVDVEVVRRLVEDQEVGAVEGGEPHQQARLLAARQVRDRAFPISSRRSRTAPRGPAPSRPVRPASAPPRGRRRWRWG